MGLSMLEPRDKIEFSKILMTIAEVVGVKLSKQAYEVYWNILKNKYNSLNDFKQVAMKLLERWNYNYMPKPAHFVTLNILTDSEIELVANEAWTDIIRALRAGGGYTKDVLFDCPITTYALNTLGGLSSLIEKTSNDLEWIKKDFVKIFILSYKTGRVGDVEVSKHKMLEYASKAVIQSRLKDSVSEDKLKILEIERYAKELAQKIDNTISEVEKYSGKGIILNYNNFKHNGVDVFSKKDVDVLTKVAGNLSQAIAIITIDGKYCLIDLIIKHLTPKIEYDIKLKMLDSNTKHNQISLKTNEDIPKYNNGIKMPEIKRF